VSEHITASPLTWPEGWKRSESQERSRFKTKKHTGYGFNEVTIAKATDFVLAELDRMGIPDPEVIISTNLRLKNDGYPYSSQREPEDKGVAVWFYDIYQQSQRVIALDKYDRIADNLYAVGKTIEAMRGIERWGSGEILERAFTGFDALPSPENVSAKSWRDVLNYFGSDLSEARKVYRKLRSKVHPDNGGSAGEYHQVKIAWQQAEHELNK